MSHTYEPVTAYKSKSGGLFNTEKEARAFDNLQRIHNYFDTHPLRLANNENLPFVKRDILISYIVANSEGVALLLEHYNRLPELKP